MPAMPVPETASASSLRRAEGVPQQAARVVEEPEELGVEVAEHRRAEGPHHAGVDGAGARAEQQPGRGVELVEDLHAAHAALAGPSSPGPEPPARAGRRPTT